MHADQIQSTFDAIVSSLFPMYTKERPSVDSHVQESLEWYVNHHDHHYLRITMGEHVGNVNTNRTQSNTLKANWRI